MARERSLNAEWLQFRMLDVAHNAPDVQIREMRKAFYAGAGSCLALVTEIEGVKMSPRDRHLIHLAVLDEIQRYLEDFKKSTQQRESNP